LRQKVPRDLETICLKCLEKDPARRYQTASDLADDLERYLSGVPVRARRTPVWERAAKWVRRRPATTTLAVVGLLVALTLAMAAERNHRRLGTRRREALFELERGRELRRRGALDDARLTFATVSTKLGPESKLADLVRIAEDELRAVDRLRILDAARAVDQERLARFRRLRDEALFLDTQFVGSVDAGRLKRTRAAARGALAVFAAGGDDPSVPGPPPVSLAPEQREEVASGCYWMLMVLSDAVARRLPGEDDRRSVQETLRYLDGAAKLRGPTLAYHLRRVACLERLGDREAARAERARADALKPTEAFDHLLLGQEWSRSGDWNAARKHFEEAVRKQPNLFWAHCLLAIADLNSRPPRVEAARAELTNCLTWQPSYPWLYLLRGTAYSQMSLSLAALARSSRDPALAGESQDQFENAEADFRAAEGLGGDVDIGYALRMNRDVLRFERQRYREAAGDFDAAIALDPRRYNAYASRAHALRKLGRRDEAIEDLSRAIALEPEVAALYRGRAMARLDRDDPPPPEVSLAIRDLEESARRESPPSSRVAADDHVRRGRLFLRLDHTGVVLDAALAAAEAALGIAPDLAGAHLLRSDALLNMGRNQEVIAACDDALARVPPSARLHFYRGVDQDASPETSWGQIGMITPEGSVANGQGNPQPRTLERKSRINMCWFGARNRVEPGTFVLDLIGPYEVTVTLFLRG
ncbi:MAG: hypothetical protein JO034_23515, partial [Singulisphaera sp.]|nr:hypothetical protein [Singulisphaera sp.]